MVLILGCFPTTAFTLVAWMMALSPRHGHLFSTPTRMLFGLFGVVGVYALYRMLRVVLRHRPRPSTLPMVAGSALEPLSASPQRVPCIASRVDPDWYARAPVTEPCPGFQVESSALETLNEQLHEAYGSLGDVRRWPVCCDRLAVLHLYGEAESHGLGMFEEHIGPVVPEALEDPNHADLLVAGLEDRVDARVQGFECSACGRIYLRLRPAE